MFEKWTYSIWIQNENMKKDKKKIYIEKVLTHRSFKGPTNSSIPLTA